MAEKSKSDLNLLPAGERAEAEFDAELEHRAAEIRNGTAVGEPAANVFAELRARYS